MENFVLSSSKHIDTYWWYCGKKTKDFSGTVDEWLTTHKIKVTRLKPKNVLPRFKFKFSLGRHNIEIVTESNDFNDAAIYVIRMWLTYLGDKSILITELKEYKINWR